VKSFSSFSFSDVALDYKDYRLYTGDAVGVSGGLLSKSDPSQLDRAEASDQDQDQDSGWDFETELSQHTTNKDTSPGMLSRNKNGRSLLETKSHSVDLWLQDHFSDGAGSKDVGGNLNIGAGDKQSSGRTLGQRENHTHNTEDGVGNREKLGGERKQVSIVESIDGEQERNARAARKKREKLLK